MSISEEKYSDLRQELNILSGKISGAVDTLWKVRTAEVTLWTAILGVGLGSFLQAGQPIIPLLILSCALPIVFINIDARNNEHYQRVTSREAAIIDVMNGDCEGYVEPFPIFDFRADFTYSQEKKESKNWKFSVIRNMADPISLSFYGSQLVFSSCICSLYAPSPWNYMFLPFSAVSIIGLTIYKACKDENLKRKDKNLNKKLPNSLSE